MESPRIDPKVYLRFLVLLWLLLIYLPSYFFDFNFDYAYYIRDNSLGFLLFWISSSAAFLLFLFLSYVAYKLKDRFALIVLALNGLVNIFSLVMFWKNFVKL